MVQRLRWIVVLSCELAASPCWTVPQEPPEGIWEVSHHGGVASVAAMLDRDAGLVNATDPATGATPLHWAASGAQADVVGLLLARGADVAARDREGRSAKDRAVEEKHDGLAALLSQAEELLLKQPVAQKAPESSVWLDQLPWQTDETSPWRPRARASFNGNALRLAQTVYTHGIGGNSTSEFGFDLKGQGIRLQSMVGIDDEAGHRGTARVTLRADGRLLADTGVIRGGEPPRVLLLDLAGVSRLTIRIDDGGDNVGYDSTTFGGALLTVTPPEAVHAAAASGNVEALERLLAIDPGAATRTDLLFGMTPLWVACLAGEAGTAARLVQRGTDPNATDARDNTVLHAAAARSGANAISVGLEVGADPRRRNADGKTPHELAAQTGNPAVVAALSDAEAGYPSIWPTEPGLRTPLKLADLDGTEVDFAALRGKVVVLCLWAESTMALSSENLAVAEALSAWPEAARGDLVVLASTPHDVQQARRFLADNEYTVHALLDPDGELKQQLQLVDRPVVVMDRQGNAVWCRRRASVAAASAAARRALNGPSATEAEPAAPTTSHQPMVVSNFEDGMGAWPQSGDCWNGAPSSEAEFPGLVKGHVGKRFVNTIGGNGIQVSGIARSPEFTIERPYIHLLVGGNDVPERGCVALECDGVARGVAVGRYSAELLPTTWYVRGLLGRQAHIEIIDAGTDDYRDYLLVDEIVQSDSPTPPAYMLTGFDPNDAAQVAATANEIPEFYRELRAGRAHMEFTPGHTYRISGEWQLEWCPLAPNATPYWSYILYPTCAWQTVHAADLTLHTAGGDFTSQVVPTQSRLMPGLLVADATSTSIPDLTASGTVMIDLTTSNAEWRLGAPPQPVEDLPQELRDYLTLPTEWYPYDDPEYQRLLTERGLRRAAGETDTAFLLRVDRFITRLGFGNGFAWGGLPAALSPGLSGLLVQRFAAISCDCGIATTMAGILRANGIPAAAGQGMWLSETGGPVGAHVRFMAFTREAGWVIGDSTLWVSPNSFPISLTAKFDDHFCFMELNDENGAEWKLVPARPPSDARACRIVSERFTSSRIAAP